MTLPQCEVVDQVDQVSVWLHLVLTMMGQQTELLFNQNGSPLMPYVDILITCFYAGFLLFFLNFFYLKLLKMYFWDTVMTRDSLYL